MPLFLVPLANLLVTLSRFALFWKSSAFLGVLLVAGTDIGKSLILWFVKLMFGIVSSIVSSLVPEFPATVPELVNQLPTQALQVLNGLRFAECMSILSMALVARFIIRSIPFIK